MKNTLIMVVWAGLMGCALPVRSQPGYDPTYVFIRSGSYVQDKNFYVLTLLEHLPELRTVMEKAPELKQIHDRQLTRLQQAATACKENITCHTEALMFTEPEIQLVGQTLNRLAKQEPAIRQMVQNHLRPCGRFQLYASLPDEQLLEKAWQDAARGLHHIIDVYGRGTPPRYPAIDSVSYPVKSAAYGKLINIITQVVQEEASTFGLFFQPTLRFALSLLEVNDRDEAARFEPMQERENKRTCQSISRIQWEKHPYVAILVPGAGPDIPGKPLDGWGKMRLQLAAQRFKKGLAPLIIVSGGNVHPFQTPFNEALEMKKELMQTYGIDEQWIIIEPHARHTTTNLRNAARLIFQYQIPASKPLLLITDPYQSTYIEGEVFQKRCVAELGYLPITGLKRLSTFDLEWIPDPQSLQSDSKDPLDP